MTVTELIEKLQEFPAHAEVGWRMIGSKVVVVTYGQELDPICQLGPPPGNPRIANRQRAMIDGTKAIAEKLRAIRKEKKLSRRELAERIGYNEHTLKSWESGRNIPALQAATDWANALGFDLVLVPHKPWESRYDQRNRIYDQIGRMP